MQYRRIYDQLIARAKTRELHTYSERHHILPRCLGGTNEKENLVDLTPEEHYVAHLLLTKIYPSNLGLLAAAVMMGARKKTNNKTYGHLRRLYSIRCSGAGGSQSGTKWITDGIKNRKLGASEELPTGWSLGRKIRKEPYLWKCKCKRCDSNFTSPTRKHFCSESCKTLHKRDLVRDNFDKLYDAYVANGRKMSSAFTKCGLGWSIKVFNRFRKMMQERGVS